MTTEEQFYIVPAETHNELVKKAYQYRGFDESECNAAAKFSAYVVDKYGQWSKASFSGNSEVTFQIPNPEIKSINPDGLGDNPELFIREDDQISFELKGLYLELVDTIRFVDSEGVDLIQNLQSLDNLSINVTPSSVSLSSTSLFQDFLPSGQEIFVFVQKLFTY